MGPWIKKTNAHCRCRFFLGDFWLLALAGGGLWRWRWLLALAGGGLLAIFGDFEDIF